MKKKILITVLVLSFFINLNAYAMEFKIFEMRNKLFRQAGQIQLLIPVSRDAMLLNSMFNSYLMATSQIDAYFFMLGIFEAIKKEDLSPAPLDSLENWLSEIKKTNDMNLRNLNIVKTKLEQDTVKQIEIMKTYLNELGKLINLELSKVFVIRKSLKTKTSQGKSR